MINRVTIHHWNNRSRRQRRSSNGYLYVAVLFTTLLVMAAVTAAVSISTSNLRGETDRAGRGQALRFVESEIQRQAVLMRTSAQWRNVVTNNVFSDWSPFTVNGVDVTGTSQSRVRFYDPDGDLADDLADPVQLTVHARVGRSEAALTVQLESDPKPLPLLHYSLTASDDIELEGGGALSCERPVQVADDCKTNTTGILTTPQLDCSGSVQITLRGDLSPSAVVMPSHDVVAQYVAVGTEIPYSAIPLSGGDLLIEDRLLSPTENPFGTADPSGIYWIDAQGSDVIISHCRFDATLAIRDAAQIEIGGGITWNYPTIPDVILATDSPIRIQNVEPRLDESARSINFNPPSSPYRASLSNTTATDIYPTELRGVIFTTHDFRLDPLVSAATLPIIGAVIGRDIRIEGSMAIRHLDELLTNPPPALSNKIPMRFVRGTFRRVPSP